MVAMHRALLAGYVAVTVAGCGTVAVPDSGTPCGNGAQLAKSMAKSTQSVAITQFGRRLRDGPIPTIRQQPTLPGPGRSRSADTAARVPAQIHRDALNEKLWRMTFQKDVFYILDSLKWSARHPDFIYFTAWELIDYSKPTSHKNLIYGYFVPPGPNARSPGGDITNLYVSPLE